MQLHGGCISYITVNTRSAIMKRTLALSLFVFAAMGALLPSCKRKELAETRKTRVQHAWKLVRTATDANANGVLDASEIHPVSESIVTTLTLNSDQSGNENVVANGVATDYPFTWTMDVKMDTITRNGVGHNVVKYFLADISSINMELTTMTDLGIAGYYYERK